MKLIHVVQHTSAEFLGLIEDHLEGRGIRFRYQRPFTGKASLPQAATIADGLFLLGGGRRSPRRSTSRAPASRVTFR